MRMNRLFSPGRIVWSTLAVLVLLAGALLGTTGGCEDRGAGDDSVLSVALTGQYPPFSTYDADGNLIGFDVDVSRAIAEQMGRDVKFVAAEWDAILPGLLTNKYDVIVGSMAVTPQREQAVNFSEPYYRSGAQLFIAKRYADEIDGIEDCSGRKVGVVLGETFQHYLESNRPDVDVRTYGGTPEIFTDVENGRLVGFVTDRLVGAWQIRKAGKEFVPAGGMLYTERMAIPVKKDRPELLEEINAALQTVRESGRLAEIHEKWFGDIAAPVAGE